MEHADEPPTNLDADGHNHSTQDSHTVPLVSNSSSANPSETSSDPDAGNHHSNHLASRGQIGQDSAKGARDQGDSQLQPHFLDTLDTSIMDLPTLACECLPCPCDFSYLRNLP
jgi:hypothetical protein